MQAGVPAHRLIEYDRERGVSRCALAVGTTPEGRIRFETIEMPLGADPEEDEAARERHIDFGLACCIAWRCFQNRAAGPPSPLRWTDECPVCLEPVTRPVSEACGHVMCYGCMVRWRAASCPVCRAPCPVGGAYFAAAEHARLAREDPGVDWMSFGAPPPASLSFPCTRSAETPSRSALRPDAQLVGR
eukprot:tig00021439_g21491.t1